MGVLKKILIIVGIVIGCLIAATILFFSGDNAELARDEVKAWFRPSVSLDFYPDLNDVGSVQIGGAITMNSYENKVHGDAEYRKKQNIEILTDYLNNLNLVYAEERELPNMSADAAIVYYDNSDVPIRKFIIYGQVFIRDLEDKTLYRVKYNPCIIEDIEALQFE